MLKVSNAEYCESTVGGLGGIARRRGRRGAADQRVLMIITAHGA